MNKNKRNLTIAGIVIVLAVALVTGIILYQNHYDSRHEALPVDQFVLSPKSYSGNVYQYEGHVDTLLGVSEGVGRIILTNAVQSTRSVPLFVPAAIQGFSPNPGQLYRFVLDVEEDGCLTVQAFKKI